MRAPVPATRADPISIFFNMVFPPIADETGGENRTAAPIHRAVCGLDLPVVDRITLREPTGHEGHGQEGFRG